MKLFESLSRRSLFQTGIGSLAGGLLVGKVDTAGAVPAAQQANVYQRLGVRTVINAVGTVDHAGRKPDA